MMGLAAPEMRERYLQDFRTRARYELAREQGDMDHGWVVQQVHLLRAVAAIQVDPLLVRESEPPR